MAFTLKNRSIACLGLLAASLFSDASATQVTDHWDIGGALRARFDRDPDRGINELGIDTFMLSAKYTNDAWTASARYRWYGHAYPYQYVRFGSVQFPEYAWMDYQFNNDQHLKVGLTQVPFGLSPLFSSTFYETLGNTIGLEDLSEIGATYQQHHGDWDVQVGLYEKPSWHGKGTSHGTTYSVVVTPADPGNQDGTNNSERHTVAMRIARDVALGEWKGQLGGSILMSSLMNSDTGGQGKRHAYAVHFQGNHGPWGVKLQFARQQMSPKNPEGRQTVAVGGYDGTFNVASRGNLYVGDLSYAVPGEYANGWISGIKPYISYSRFEKSAKNFNTSERLFLGTSFSVKAIYVAIEWMNGRNDPYIGGSSYTQSLAVGGINRWKSQLYMNVGYYF